MQGPGHLRRRRCGVETPAHPASRWRPASRASAASGSISATSIRRPSIRRTGRGDPDGSSSRAPARCCTGWQPPTWGDCTTCHVLTCHVPRATLGRKCVSCDVGTCTLLPYTGTSHVARTRDDLEIRMTYKMGVVGLGVMGAQSRPQHREQRIPRRRLRPRRGEDAGASSTGRRRARRSPARTRPTQLMADARAAAARADDGAGRASRSTASSRTCAAPRARRHPDRRRQLATSPTPIGAQTTLAAAGFRFVGTGVSGGEEGALRGPAIMPGGPREAWDALAPIFRAIAAKADDGEPCVEYMGPRGAGHYVKMVHNGIEYGDMQLIAEVYDVLHRGAGLSRARDRRHLRGVERRRAAVVPDRDHRAASSTQRRPRDRASRWSTSSSTRRSRRAPASG